jgi:hypothetical protein
VAFRADCPYIKSDHALRGGSSFAAAIGASQFFTPQFELDAVGGNRSPRDREDTLREQGKPLQAALAEGLRKSSK